MPQGCHDVQPGRRHGRVQKKESPRMSQELQEGILEHRGTNNVSNEE